MVHDSNRNDSGSSAPARDSIPCRAWRQQEGRRRRDGLCRRVRARTLVVAGHPARCPVGPGRRGIGWEWNPSCSREEPSGSKESSERPQEKWLQSPSPVSRSTAAVFRLLFALSRIISLFIRYWFSL